MTSNYNVLTLPMKCDGKYKVGDVFSIGDENKKSCYWRLLKFEGLQIKNIDYNFGVRLHFDRNEWSKNNPFNHIPRNPVPNFKLYRFL